MYYSDNVFWSIFTVVCRNEALAAGGLVPKSCPDCGFGPCTKPLVTEPTHGVRIETLLKLSKRMREIAHQKREDAGYSGSWGDNGARALEETCDAFEAGLQGKCPDAWKEELAKMQRENDPEYKEFLRLKQKFGEV